LARRFIDVHIVGRADVQEVFRKSDKRNKNLIAATIALTFPELKWKLPQKRRPWQPERYNSAIFDAVALAITCRSRYGGYDKPPDPKGYIGDLSLLEEVYGAKVSCGAEWG
jgi:hypothetical protein